MASGDVWEVVARFTQKNVDGLITTRFRLLEVLAAPTITDVGDAWADCWDNGDTTPLGAYYDEDTKFEDVTLRKVSPLAPSIAIYDTGMPRPGTETTSNPMPSQDSILVSLRTPNIGRSYRGRMYLPAPVVGIQEADTELISAGSAGEIQEDMAKLLLVDLNTIEYHPIVWSETVPATTSVTAVRVDRRLRTQRRRGGDDSAIYVG